MMEERFEPIEVLTMKEFSKLVGVLLTHVESIFPDKVQRESNKKIIEREIYRCRDNILDLLKEIYKE